MSLQYRTALGAFAVLLALGITGCGNGGDGGGEPTSPYGSTSSDAETAGFFDEITNARYNTWATAPGYEASQPAKGPHGDEVRIFLSPSAERALSGGASQWPEGAVVVKDVYKNGAFYQVAAGKKTADGWYWGEWDAMGTVIAEGLKAEPCEGCHADGGSDGTLGVKLQ